VPALSPAYDCRAGRAAGLASLECTEVWFGLALRYTIVRKQSCVAVFGDGQGKE
jgi:hypothetical protein